MLAHFDGPDGCYSIRAYSLTLLGAEVSAVEMYPQDNRNSRLLGTVAIAPTAKQELQIEHETGGLQFLVNGKPIQLVAQPNLPDGSTWGNWVVEGYATYAGEQGSRVSEVEIDWVAMKPGPLS